jgi:hypothetical protein
LRGREQQEDDIEKGGVVERDAHLDNLRLRSDGMTSSASSLLLVSIIAVFVGQAAGVWLWRRKHPRATAAL